MTTPKRGGIIRLDLQQLMNTLGMPSRSKVVDAHLTRSRADQRRLALAVMVVTDDERFPEVPEGYPVPDVRVAVESKGPPATIASVLVLPEDQWGPWEVR